MLPNDLTATPYYHDRAMEILRASQGTLTYDQSVSHAKEQLQSESDARRRAEYQKQQAAKLKAPVPTHHEAALRYMREHGTSYDLACLLVKQREPRNRAVHKPPHLNVDHLMPAHHAPAITYMMEHPGTSYDAAVELVKSGRAGSGSLGDVMAKLMETPPHHDSAMTYMREHPGTTYDAACAHVLSK